MHTSMFRLLLVSGALSMMAEGEGSTEADTQGGGAAPATVSFSAPVPQVKTFNALAPAEFGNSLLASLLQSTSFDEELAAAQSTSDQVKSYIHFELTKAIMHAAESITDLNLFAIFEGASKVEKLNTKLMQHFGIIKREIKDDDIVTSWTSKEMQEAYDYTAVDKEKDANEFNRRFNNRKRLNMRFSEAVKVAVALLDKQVKGEQLQLVEDPTSKKLEAVINNAPADLRGDVEKNPSSTVKFGQRNPQEGAKVAPNVASLVRAATEAHKKADPAATGTGERADKGGDRSGDAKLGMSDEDFGAMVNNLRRAIAAQEGSLSPEMVKQLQALVPYIDEQVKVTLSKPKDEAAGEAELNKPMTDAERGEAQTAPAKAAKKAAAKQ